MFPAVDRSQPSAPLPTGYHGETFLLPWDWRIEAHTQDEVALVLSTRCVRSPFAVERRLSLTRQHSEIVVETLARNLGQTSANLSLGEHITLKIDDYLAGATLEMDGGTAIETSGPSPPESLISSDASGQWPFLPGSNGELVDLSRIDSGREGHSDVFGARWRAPGLVKLIPDRQEVPAISISWDSEVLPTAVFWYALGGDTAPPWYGSARLLAVEPMSMLPWQEEWHTLEPGQELAYTGPPPRAGREYATVTAAVAVLLAALAAGFSGFGFNVVAVPLLALVLPVKDAVTIGLVLGLLATGFSALLALRRDQINPSRYSSSF